MTKLLGDCLAVALFGLLALFAITVIASKARSQPAQAPPVVPMPPQAPPVKSDKPTPKIVFVSTAARPIPGTITIRDDAWHPSAAIVVYPKGYGPGVTLSANASDADIAAAIAGRQVTATRPAFFQESSEVPVAADDKPYHDHGSLPVGIREMLAGGIRYKRAKYTQSIGQTRMMSSREPFRPFQRPVERSQTELKYQVPGGMEGVHGWRSDLYKNVSVLGQLASIGVVNSDGFVQHELGWSRRYGDGTWFADVLSHNGKVFEVRLREKEKGTWTGYVAFKNKNARPVGYHGMKQTCVDCHNAVNGPGTGGYAVGLVPGSDTVFSDPFDALER